MILRMPPEKGLEFYEEAKRQRQEDKLYMRWVAGYQAYMSFAEFKRVASESAGTSMYTESGHCQRELTEAETLAKVKGILEMAHGNF